MPVTRFAFSCSPLFASTLLALATLALTALVAPAAHAQNLLTNGSFELGTFDGNSNPEGSSANTNQLFVGSTAMTGWTVVNDELAWTQNVNRYNISAIDGVRSLDLTGYTDSQPHGGVSQTVATTLGRSYTLSFAIGYNSGYSTPTVAVDASTGGAFTTFSCSPTTLSGQQWTTVSQTFTATGAQTTVTLRGSTQTGGNYIGLDNVSLTANGAATAPEPGSVAFLIVVGVPAVGLVRRHKQHA